MRNIHVNVNIDEVKKHLKLAEDRLKAARILCQAELYKDAVSRAYYAFFDSATAALLLKGIIAKTHAGLLQLFSLHFIKSGEIDSKFIRLFKQVERSREEADYEVYRNFTKQETEEVIKYADEFVMEIESKLKPKLKAK